MIKIQIRFMSDPFPSDVDFKDKMAELSLKIGGVIVVFFMVLLTRKS